MSDRFNIPPGMQGIVSQVLREIQSGLSRLESTINSATGSVPIDEDEVGTNPPQTRQETPQPRTSNYTGPRWEYKVAYVNFRGQISSEGEQVLIGRGERRSTFVRKYLDELGSEGWELVGVSPLGLSENSYFVFRRPATGWPKPSTESTNSSEKVQVEEVDENANKGEFI